MCSLISFQVIVRFCYTIFSLIFFERSKPKQVIMAKPRRSTTKHTDDEDSSESWDREEGSNFDPEEGSNWDSTEQSQTSNETPEKKPVIGAAENRRVIYSRILVAAVLAVSAAATAFGAYWLTAKEETNNFERDVSALAVALRL